MARSFFHWLFSDATPREGAPENGAPRAAVDAQPLRLPDPVLKFRELLAEAGGKDDAGRVLVGFGPFTPAGDAIATAREGTAVMAKSYAAARRLYTDATGRRLPARPRMVLIKHQWPTHNENETLLLDEIVIETRAEPR